MKVDLECLYCNEEIEVTWDNVGYGITCEHCGHKMDVGCDEDMDCNYWFELEKIEEV